MTQDLFDSIRLKKKNNTMLENSVATIKLFGVTLIKLKIVHVQIKNLLKKKLDITFLLKLRWSYN